MTLDISPDPRLPGCLVESTVKVTGPTGVEMEALTAISVACLTLYDMIKAVERGVRIEGIRLLEKTGGKSGHYRAESFNASDRLFPANFRREFCVPSPVLSNGICPPPPPPPPPPRRQFLFAENQTG